LVAAARSSGFQVGDDRGCEGRLVDMRRMMITGKSDGPSGPPIRFDPGIFDIVSMYGFFVFVKPKNVYENVPARSFVPLSENFSVVEPDMLRQSRVMLERKFVFNDSEEEGPVAVFEGDKRLYNVLFMAFNDGLRSVKVGEFDFPSAPSVYGSKTRYVSTSVVPFCSFPLVADVKNSHSPVKMTFVTGFFC